MLLPKEWWKLSFLWFANLKSRSPAAKRGLFRSSFRISILSVAIGVGALSVTLAVVTGFEWTLGETVYKHQGHVVHVSRRWRTLDDLKAFADQAPDSVKRAVYYWNSQGLVVGSQGGRGVLIEGQRDARLPTTDRNFNEVQVRIGRALATHIGVKKGDQVRLLMPGVVRGAVQARVTELVGFGIYETDSRMVYVDDESLRSVLKKKDPESFAKRPGDGHGIRFYLDPKVYGPGELKRLDQWISTYQKRVLDIDPDENVQRILNWREQKASIFRGIGHNKEELTLVISILTLVAALNVAATLIVLFLERDREMAVLQAIGMSGFQIFQWICIQGLMMGFAASTVGIVMGRIFGAVLVRLPFARVPYEVYNLEVLPLKFELVDQTTVYVFGVFSSVLIAALIGALFANSKLVTVLGSAR